jgi:hypothetical protein
VVRNQTQSSVKKAIALIAIFSSLSCSPYHGYISIKNAGEDFLKIQTYPRIKECDACDKGIMSYTKDSLLWIYGTGIRAIIQRPVSSEDNFLSKYRQSRNDTATYLMFPNSRFVIGQFNATSKVRPQKDQASGNFTISRLEVYTSAGVSAANGNLEIWNLLVSLDGNRKDRKKGKRPKRVKNWTVEVVE